MRTSAERSVRQLAHVTRKGNRGRALVIVDSMGRERIIMGGPIPEPAGARIAPSTGLAIRDTAGAERFGMGLFPDGRFVMGFDAPPGAGDDRNRERITILADQRGGAHIRFLDRRTAVRGYLMLGDDNNVYLQLMGDSASKRFVRRIGVFGDTTASTAR